MSSHERQVVRVHIRSQAAQTSSHHHREENGDYGAGSGIGVESKNCSLHKSLGLVQVFEGERLEFLRHSVRLVPTDASEMRL